MPDAPLRGKVAIVTGGASGIGRASAGALARDGAAVALFDMDGERLESVCRELRAAGSTVFGTVIDLVDLAAIGPAVAGVIAQLHRVDILVNAAGVFSSDQLLELDLEHWHRSITLNLTAPAVLIHHVATQLVAQAEGGRIVNISSSSAYRASKDGGSVYAAGKAGLVGLTRAAAGQLSAYDVNVNAVVPGLTATEVALRYLGREEMERRVSTGGSSPNLFGRLSEPMDVAETVAFLCRPESRQITGQAIHTSAGAIIP